MKLRALGLVFGFAIGSLGSPGASLADGPPRLAQTYPRSAMPVSVANAATLQTLLDTHGSVRLERGDYSASPPITLRSGQALYGLGSVLPTVTIEPGATGIIIANVRFAGELRFPPSSLVTRHNFFFEVGGDIVVDGATLEENTILGLENGTLRVDVSTGGWLRNNRFIRIRAHGLMPLLRMVGDSAHQSYGNVFVWGNQLTQPNNMVSVTGQRDVTFVGWDDEAYADPTMDPIYRFQDIDTLRLWTMGGASTTTNQALFHIDAREAQLSNVTMGGASPTPIVLTANVERAFMFNSRSITDGNPAGLRLSGILSVNNNSGSVLEDHGALVTAALPTATASALTTMYTTHVGEPWERPVFDPIPNPTGADWAVDLASRPDSTAMLQARIDAESVVFLDPGTYYISSPLRLRRETRIVGSGADVTAIVAKDPRIDIIVDGDTSDMAHNHLQILDLTLQGGANGVHLIGPPGQARQYSEFLFSNVVFRDFTNAGFFTDQIFGLDNGLFNHVDFVNCGTGFKQYVDPMAEPAGANSGYIDKVMFYNNQFVGNGTGAELIASRANNLNSFVNCRFEDNANGALIGHYNNDLQLINSDLINNGGAPTIVDVADVISCYFRADERGVSFLNSGRVEGTRFERGSSTTARIYEQSEDTFFAANNAWANFSFDYLVNSSADDIAVGNVEFGIFLNNNLPARPDLSKPAAIVWIGDVTTLAEGAVNPRAQLLVGANYAEPPIEPGQDAGVTTTDAGRVDAGTSGGTPTSSCGCRTATSTRTPFAALSLLGLALAVRRRRNVAR